MHQVAAIEHGHNSSYFNVARIFRGFGCKKQSFPTREERSARGTRPLGGLPFKRQTAPYLAKKGVVCLSLGRPPFQNFVIHEKVVVINKASNPVPTLFGKFSKGMVINWAFMLYLVDAWVFPDNDSK